MPNLVAPANEQIVQNGITFTVEHKLSQSLEKDWAPFDEILTLVLDDARMIVAVATTKSAKIAKKFVKDTVATGLTRHPDSFDLLARRSQRNLFCLGDFI
jgi:hypothetical protein